MERLCQAKVLGLTLVLLLSTFSVSHSFGQGQEVSIVQIASQAEIADTNAVFDFAELVESAHFRPRGEVQTLGRDVDGEGWLYRYYPQTDTYAAVHLPTKGVYVLGQQFGSDILFVDSLPKLVNLVTQELARDADGDGVGDLIDACPNDPDETRDSDGDGICDNADADLSFNEMAINPLAIWDSRIGKDEICVSTYAAGAELDYVEVHYLDDLKLGTLNKFTVRLVDDGSVNDEVAGDGYWNACFVPQLTVPPHMRVFNQFDATEFSFVSYDKTGAVIAGPARSALLGVVSTTQDALARTNGVNALVTNSLVNIIEDDFHGMQSAKKLSSLYYNLFPQSDPDFLTLFSGKSTGDSGSRSLNVQNTVLGIGAPIFDNSATFRSAGNLQQISYHDNVTFCQDCVHHWAHLWTVYLTDPNLPLSDANSHWAASEILDPMHSIYLHRDGANLVVQSPPDGAQRYSRSFSEQTLYLMGLANLTQLEIDPYFITDTSIDVSPGSVIPLASATKVTGQMIEDVYGQRLPDYLDTQTDFSAVFVIVTDSKRGFLKKPEYVYLNTVARYYGGNSAAGGIFDGINVPPSFRQATYLRGTLDTHAPALPLP